MQEKNQKRALAIWGVLLGALFFILPVHAQDQIAPSSSPNSLGSGARAIGMGGAFIAISDDGTAASWNPAGLIQLERPEMSVVLDCMRRKEDNSFGTNPEASGLEAVNNCNLNYLSVTCPFKVNHRDMVASLSYQRLYDFTRDWNFNLALDNPVFIGPVQYDYERNGALYALSFSYSFRITSYFSAGFTLNYWGDSLSQNKWEQKNRMEYVFSPADSEKIIYYSSDIKDEYAFQGWNANMGFLFKINNSWTLGGVFKTPFTADLDHTKTKRDITSSLSSPENDSHEIFSSREDYEKLRMPMSYGIGLAYRFSDNFTISGDIYRTHWNDFESEDAQGKRTSPVTGEDMSKSDIDPTTSLRMGAEYLIIGKKTVVPLRAGIFYDPAPAEGSPDDYYGFSLGTGLTYKRFILDIACQFRFGNDVGCSILQALDFSQDVQEHTVFTSLIIRF